MKKWCQTHSGNLFVMLFLLMVLVIGSAYFTENLLVLRLVLLSSIPLYFGFYVLKGERLSILIISFLLFAFLGNAFSAIFLEANYVGISNMLYLLALMSLTFNFVPQFKMQLQNRNTWLIVYLLGMFAIGLCFLLEISHAFRALILNDIEFYVFVFQALILLVLGVLSFGVYLNTQSHSAIRFLMSILCFGFALGVNYVSAFYLYDYIFELLNGLFYISGLYFVLKFLLTQNKAIPKKSIEDCEVFYSEIVYA